MQIDKDNIINSCDEFILSEQMFIDPTRWVGNKMLSYCYKFDSDEPIRNYEVKPEDEIYGAIWTDKGLIYVAKMNKNCELELI